MTTSYLFKLKDPEHHIYLFGNKHSDLYHLMQNQIRGGLSMVYNRYQEQNKTKVRPEGKTTQVCEGWDVSSLYLSNLAMQSMPTGRFVRRHCENSFKLEKGWHGCSEKSIKYIRCLERKLVVKFQHMFNGIDKCLRIKKIYVDRYENLGSTELVAQFSGCYFHSHMRKSPPVDKHQNMEKNLKNKLETYKTLQYFQNIGYIIYHLWECKFDSLRRDNKEINDCCKNLNFVIDDRYYLSKNQNLKEIADGSMFGFAKVDLHTPEKVNKFQPIAKHAQVPIL